MDNEVVWLHEYRCFAFLVSMGTYYSTVFVPGEDAEFLEVENDDYDLWGERAIDYESD